MAECADLPVLVVCSVMDQTDIALVVHEQIAVEARARSSVHETHAQHFLLLTVVWDNETITDPALRHTAPTWVLTFCLWDDVLLLLADPP